MLTRLTSHTLSFSLCALGFSLAANAQDINVDMQPGLWEHEFSLVGGADQKAQNQQLNKAMAEMKKQLANMPPEQRKMMEDIFSRQGMNISEKGVSMQNGEIQLGLNGATIKQCVTQAQIDEGFVPKGQNGCTTKMTQSSKTTIKVTYQCTGTTESTGEGEITFSSPKKYQGSARLVSTVDGKSQTFATKQSGKWLASDCGDIKP